MSQGLNTNTNLLAAIQQASKDIEVKGEDDNKFALDNGDEDKLGFDIKPISRSKTKRVRRNPRANRLIAKLKEQVSDGRTEMDDNEIKSVKGSVKTNAVDTA